MRAPVKAIFLRSASRADASSFTPQAFCSTRDDLEDFMGVTRGQIECYYGLVEPEWNVDSHEKCIGEHQTQIRKLLGITDRWKCG